MEMLLLAVVLAVLLGLAWLRLASKARLARLATLEFPDHIAGKVRTTYPHLSEDECRTVLEGLREFFAVALLARGRYVAMPSQAVDVAWHEFILSTRAYRDFCRRVLGRFLHHTPAEAMRSRTHAPAGIRKAWALACRREGIDPKSPGRLPLLFGIDAALSIPGGYRYALDCRTAGVLSGVYCASDIGCGGSGYGGGGCGGDSGDSGGDGGCGGD